MESDEEPEIYALDTGGRIWHAVFDMSEDQYKWYLIPGPETSRQMTDFEILEQEQERLRKEANDSEGEDDAGTTRGSVLDRGISDSESATGENDS